MNKPTVLHYTYYHCARRVNPKCPERSVELGEFEKQIKERLEGIEISDYFMDWAIKQINNENDSERDFREEKIASLKRAHDDCRQKLDNLLKLKISPMNTDGSLISDEKFKTENQALEAELKSLEKQLVEVDDRMVKSARDLADMFDFAAHAKEEFENGNLEKKRKILSDLGSNLILEGKELRLDAPEYFVKIKEMKDGEPKIGRKFEPTEKGYTKAQLEQLYLSNPTVSRGKDNMPNPPRRISEQLLAFGKIADRIP